MCRRGENILNFLLSSDAVSVDRMLLMVVGLGEWKFHDMW